MTWFLFLMFSSLPLLAQGPAPVQLAQAEGSDNAYPYASEDESENTYGAEMEFEDEWDPETDEALETEGYENYLEEDQEWEDQEEFDQLNVEEEFGFEEEDLEEYEEEKGQKIPPYQPPEQNQKPPQSNPAASPQQPLKEPPKINLKYPVELIVTSDCKECAWLENYFRAVKIPFTKYNIDSDEEALEKYNDAGEGELPMTIYGPKVIRGYKLGEIYETLMAP